MERGASARGRVFAALVSILSVAGSSATALAQVDAAAGAEAASTTSEPASSEPTAAETTAIMYAPPPPADPTPEPMTGPWDWVRMVSGEWLRGEITSMRDGTLVFDSEKFGDLTVDWADVVEVYSPNPNRFVHGVDRAIEGRVHLVGEEVVLVTDQGEVRMPRSELSAILPGELREASRWSGHLGVGFNGTWGASQQTTFNTNAWLMREAARNRARLDYTASWGKAADTVNVNNMWGTGRFDLYVSRVFFLTPVVGEVGYNRFLNLGLRAIVGAGAGVHAIDIPKLEWDLSAGGSYLYTRYASVVAPASDVQNDGAVLLGTSLHWDVYTDIDLDLRHTSLLVPTSFGTSQFDTKLTFSMKLWGHLDFDLTFRHTRIRQPETRADGTVPDKDQFQLIVGLGLDL